MSYPKYGLTFDEFQELNKKRCQTKFNHPDLTTWLPVGWACAITGEAGELANLCKKVLRGDFTIDQVREEMIKELADIITYSDLMLSALGCPTEAAIKNKFNEVSKRVGFGERL